MTMTIESRTIGGVCYLSASAVAAGLRGRAEEVEALALALGDDVDGEEYTTAVAYHTVARELRERADGIDFGVIAHLTEQPGDSNLGHSASPAPGG